MRRFVQTPWLQATQLLQLCTIMWLIAAQVIACSVQNIDDYSKIFISIASAACILLPMMLFCFYELKSWQAFLLLLLEVVLATVSSVTCLVAGFYLLFLITALKAGILSSRTGFALTSALATFCFAIFSQMNLKVMIQPTGSSNEIMSLVFGREFVGFATGMILVVVLVSAMRREQENRKEAERLSSRLVVLATELERNRISIEINHNVDNLLEQVVAEVQTTSSLLSMSDSSQPQLSLKQARELAARALTEVRRSLSLLRDLENSKSLIFLLLFTLSASSCQKNSTSDLSSSLRSAKADTARSAESGSSLSANSRAALEQFKSGVKYQQSGRIELSRQALENAIELDPLGKVGNSARVVIRTKLPRYSVSAEAEQRNIVGFNQMNHGDISAAQKTFSSLINEFPQFEYPYGNLVYLYIQEKKLGEAKTLLRRVLQINPNYLNGWKYLAEVQRIEKDNVGYKQSIDRINALRLGQEYGSKEPELGVD